MWTKLIKKITLSDLPEDRKKKVKQRIKLITILSIEFIAIISVLLLIFLAGKKTYTVTFDLNGGILIGGDLEQTVMQGQSATPPNTAKHGHYLRGWSGSYKSVTRDITVKAIWEYNTSPGVEYHVPENTNYCEISGCFKEIQGELFIGSYYNDKPVLGIKEGSFKDMTGITAIHLLDGILTIKAEAFAGCTSMEVFDMPGTIIRIGKEAFKDCRELKSITLPNTLQIIEAGAFAGCEGLTEIVIPDSVHTIEAGAFEGCSSLEKITISSGIDTIEAETFKNCTSLKEIIIPEAVEVIGDMAFAGCTSLEKVIFHGDPIFMASNPVEDEKEEENEEETDKKDKDEEEEKDNAEGDEEIKEEEKPTHKGVTKIGSGAFAGCTSLKEIVIPASVTEIGKYAFTTYKMEVKLYISEEKLPAGYDSDWHSDRVIVVFEYDPADPESGLPSIPEIEEDEVYDDSWIQEWIDSYEIDMQVNSTSDDAVSDEKLDTDESNSDIAKGGSV
ncbi:MAG: leucine-rich repeat protein [Clostridia bacterium]|nr:leucine-rich repeat protein [Clostridia bacterium]